MSSQIEYPTTDDPEIRHSAKALIIRADRVLLVKERHADGSFFWTVPGGGVERNESKPAALHRELFEELQCWGAIEKKITQFWYAHRSCENTVSLCSVYDCSLISAAEPNHREGILATRWAAPSELPAKTLPQVRYLIKTQIPTEESSY